MIEPTTFEQYADEERVYAFDFSQQVEQQPIPDILNPVITITPSGPPPVLQASAPTISGAMVKVSLNGGVAGVTYTIRCHIETSQGSELTAYGKLMIPPAP